jgi:hypothetical protein
MGQEVSRVVVLDLHSQDEHMNISMMKMLIEALSKEQFY